MSTTAPVLDPYSLGSVDAIVGGRDFFGDALDVGTGEHAPCARKTRSSAVQVMSSGWFLLFAPSQLSL